ncbi:hypothetical protein BEL04_23090 [Mucilaginibacter sp. PPCGB 2223]|uniref:hypothetical protein n=1 Tax=Mucilaginibacter sp. PPCGB 2223 TaxID=1886027 RepID=UPI00082470A4|nr:hypothetical protein [Mucilaginibacter sp. PPCGB 2223]OCX50658.1 hypothetical protein BEL04_23090 [Mucilaginibacter sp. PPCGB 2223]
MDDRDYKPYYIGSYELTGEHLILKVEPMYLDHPVSEIHIKSKDIQRFATYWHALPRLIAESVPIFICEETWGEKTTLAVYEGQFLQESEVSYWLSFYYFENK